MLVGATTIAVEPLRDEVHGTYVQGAQIQTVAAKFVVMATPKFITAKILAGLPDDQFDAMKSIRYCPYAVVNMIFDRQVYDKAYDTWCPRNTFTDFVVSNWVVRNQSQPGVRPGLRPAREEGPRSRGNLSAPSQAQRNVNILTFYAPMAESDRKKLLDENGCRALAGHVLDDFKKLLPEFSLDPIEVRFYRRGHPMFLPTPGTFTKTIPAASQPLDRVYFADTDSICPVSDIGAAVESAQRASEWIKRQMGE